ncbi:MAG: glycosyltransferase family 4 protein [Pirellulales bacterium]
MRILVLTDNFIPEITAPSFRVRDHAREWLQQGHDVTVVTCVPNWPHGAVFPGYKNRLYQEEWIDGIRVIRLGTYITANRGFGKRVLDYLSFMAMAILFCWKYPRFDVVLATSPQFFTAVAGWAVSILRWRPWVFEVRDLWPASIRAVGASRSRVLVWLEQLELFLYHRANRIVVVTPAFRKDLIARGVFAGKIDVVTNGVDGAYFTREKVDRDARADLGIAPGTFLAGYIGTTGMAHGLEILLAAANRLRHRRQIRFLIMGDGALRERLEARARQMNLTNVQFCNRVPQAEVARYYAALDLSIVSLKPEPVFRTVLPSKLFELMAMEVPVLLAVEGEAARVVGDAKCGALVPPGDAGAMARAVERLSNDRFTLREMGRRGRMAALKQYDRTDLALRALDSLLAALGDPRRASESGERLAPQAMRPQESPARRRAA